MGVSLVWWFALGSTKVSEWLSVSGVGLGIGLGVCPGFDLGVWAQGFA